MSTYFDIPDEFEGLRLYAGGRTFEFDGTELEVEDEADAKRVRQFAIENPGYGIAEDGETVVYRAPAPDPAESGEIAAEPEGDGQDEPTAPQDDAEAASAVEGADAPAADPATDGDATDAATEDTDPAGPDEEPADAQPGGDE